MSYDYEKIIKSDLLQQEIINAELTGINYIDTVGGNVYIYFNEELNEEQKNTLDLIVAAHDCSMSAELIIKNKILAAMDFGRNLLAEYAASNVISELTVEQIQDVMVKTMKTKAALNMGSLYLALIELDLVETDETIITIPRVNDFRNKIKVYLNIPLT